jgi:hypothetical protein
MAVGIAASAALSWLVLSGVRIARHCSVQRRVCVAVCGETFRLFNCRRCHCQLRLCSECDRGDLYCADCALFCRAEARRRARVTGSSGLVSERRRETRWQQCSALRVAREESGLIELCARSPGPSFTECGGPGGGAASTGGEEGYMRVHAGVHGIGDLTASQRDWRNPVARITIRRMPR